MMHTATVAAGYARDVRERALRRGTTIDVREEQPDGERCVFEARAYRRAYRMARILRIATGTDGSLLFEDRGDHAVCLARSAMLDAREIEAACTTLFDSDRLRFVVFEDIGLGDAPKLRFAPMTFRYQSDWVIPLGHDADGMPASLRRKTGKDFARLRRQHGAISLSIEPSPSRALVAEAIALSRKKFEASGRSYLIDKAEEERLAGLFGSIGTAAVLRDGDHVVSCDLFVEHGLDCYAFLGGYDMDYARFGPGTITMCHAVEHFEARGFRSAHFLWGDGGYKARLGAEAVPMTSMIVPKDARALANPRLLSHGLRFARQHLRERLRERPWLGTQLRRMLDGFRSLRAALRNRTA